MTWRTLLITTNPHHAHVVAARLQAKDFTVVLHEVSGGGGSRRFAYGEFRVLVPEDDYDLARDALMLLDMETDLLSPGDGDP